MPVNSFWRSFGIFAAGFATCVALIIGGFSLFYFLSVKPMVDRVTKSGLRAPSFPEEHRPAVLEGTWTRSDGTQLQLAGLRGKVVVLNVWATWCGPCMAELPSFAKLAEHYAGNREVQVVCVTKEPVSTVLTKLKGHAALSVACSTNGVELPKIYRTSAIPATFIIDRDGEIVFQHVGSANWACEEAFQFIERVRGGRPSAELPEPASPGKTSTAAASNPTAAKT